MSAEAERTDSTDPPEGGRRTVRPTSIGLAFAVLEAVADLQPIGVGELARKMSVPKSSVQRMLRALETQGYVFKSTTPVKWQLTLRAFRIGSRAAIPDLRSIARPEMERLLAATHDAVNLFVLDGHEVVLIEKIDSPRVVRAFIERGAALPAWTTASGRVLLAHLPPHRLKAALEQSKLSHHLPPTDVDLERLHDELERVRTVGWAGNDNELCDEVAAVAAPIHDASGAAIAAICVTSPAARLPQHAHAQVAVDVKEASRRLSRQLGHVD